MESFGVFFVFVLGENNKALETKKNVLFSCKCAKFFCPSSTMAAFVGMALYNQIEKDLKSFFNFFVVLRDFFFISRISWYFSFFFNH